MDDDDDVVDVDPIVLERCARIRPDGKGQQLTIDDSEGAPPVTQVTAEYAVSFLQRMSSCSHHPRAVVTRLSLNLKNPSQEEDAMNVMCNYLGDSTTCTLKTLELYRCYWPIWGRGLRSTNMSTSITTLFIHGYTLDPDTYDSRTRPPLGHLLEGNESLLRFRLWDWRLDLGVGGAQSLQSGLAVNATLTTLEIRRCSLKDNGARLICTGLLSNNNLTLTVLNLSDNELTAACLPAIAQLMETSRVTKLILSGNVGILPSNKGAQVPIFANALASTSCPVEILDLSNCKVRGWAAAQLFQALETNETLQTLLLRSATPEPDAVYQQHNRQGRNQLVTSAPLMKGLRHLSYDWDFSADAEVFVPILDDPRNKFTLLKLDGQDRQRSLAHPRFGRISVLLCALNMERARVLGGYIPPSSGFWANAFARFAGGDVTSRASAVFEILRTNDSVLGDIGLLSDVEDE